MNTLKPCRLLLLLGILTLLAAQPAAAQLHRATRLGNPATRFAYPLFSPDDLRARFRDEKLQPDFIAVLDQWGWQGDPADLFRAARTNEISDTHILIGERMPFMSTRENGKPICLRDVMWAGKEPAPAYAFTFSSKGRRYRCVTPKACSNFYLEDLGPEPAAALTLSCNAPAEITTGRAVDVCLTLINHGTAPSGPLTLILPIPAQVRVASRTDSAVVTTNQLIWRLPALGPNQGKQVCAVFKSSRPGVLAFNASATSTGTNEAATACETRIVGVPAILLEVIDLDDPIDVGGEVTYEIRVLNQGTATGTNVRLECALPPSQQFVSATGSSPGSCTNGVITLQRIAVLPPKEQLSWLVKTKALVADDARFKVELHSDQFATPITEDESTQQF